VVKSVTQPRSPNTIRNRLVVAATLLLASAGVAHAASEPTLPREFHGEWCPSDTADDYFYRPTSPTDCTDVERIIVEPTGVRFHRDTCTLLRVTTTPPKRRGQAASPAVVGVPKLYQFVCRSTASPNNRPTTFYSELRLSRGYLHMNQIVD
jgi:hypothetical protein